MQSGSLGTLLAGTGAQPLNGFGCGFYSCISANRGRRCGHVCRVVDAFVNGLKMAVLGFERAEVADRF